MKCSIIIAVFAISLMGCTRSPVIRRVAHPSQPAAAAVMTVSSLTGIEESLSFANLLGTWLHLDSEGEIAKDGDRIAFSKSDDKYVGILSYQGSMRKCQLVQANGEYLILSESGEKYRIARIESINPNENGGIGVDLIVGPGFDDIGLGFFQREDILKKLEGQ